MSFILPQFFYTMFYVYQLYRCAFVTILIKRRVSQSVQFILSCPKSSLDVSYVLFSWSLSFCTGQTKVHCDLYRLRTLCNGNYRPVLFSG